jgi:uncharacterized protein YjbI with pentapeptide repeats
LNSADLIKANLTGANLTEANLSNAKLIDSLLNNANLKRANLTEAYLTLSNLQRSKLIKATLCRSYVNGSTFEKANLKGTDLRDVYVIEQANFKEAIYDRLTNFDTTFNPISEGMIDNTSKVSKIIDRLSKTQKHLLRHLNLNKYIQKLLALYSV